MKYEISFTELKCGRVDVSCRIVHKGTPLEEKFGGSVMEALRVTLISYYKQGETTSALDTEKK
jgi:hypothetical protein